MGDSIFGDLQIAASVQWPAPATSLAELALAVERLHGEPVLTLRQALAQLQLLDDDTLDALQRERPELLRNRSSELVKRLLVSGDELSHALSRMAGLPEVDRYLVIAGNPTVSQGISFVGSTSTGVKIYSGAAAAD